MTINLKHTIFCILIISACNQKDNKRAKLINKINQFQDKLCQETPYFNIELIGKYDKNGKLAFSWRNGFSYQFTSSDIITEKKYLMKSDRLLKLYHLNIIDSLVEDKTEYFNDDSYLFYRNFDFDHHVPFRESVEKVVAQVGADQVSNEVIYMKLKGFKSIMPITKEINFWESRKKVQDYIKRKYVYIGQPMKRDDKVGEHIYIEYNYKKTDYYKDVSAVIKAMDISYQIGETDKIHKKAYDIEKVDTAYIEQRMRLLHKEKLSKSYNYNDHDPGYQITITLTCPCNKFAEVVFGIRPDGSEVDIPIYIGKDTIHYRYKAAD